MVNSDPNFNFEEGEIVLLNKPLYWTSTDVVRKLRNATGIKKTGHAGTLDPLATGLLIVCIGRKATTSIDDLQNQDKEYTGIISLGATTPSYDMETPVNQLYDISSLSEPEIRAAARSLCGTYMQVAPVYSAIKVGGKPMYKQAHKGIAVEPKSREVTIYDFDIERIDIPDVYFRVRCSKGTYIRSLAHDLGAVLHNGAYLKQLCRTRSGNYRLEDAWDLEALVEAIKTYRGRA